MGRNIHQQIDEVDRELAMRRSVYRGGVGRGKLRQAEADEAMMARMEAVRDTLVFCRDNRDAIADAKRRADGGAE